MIFDYNELGFELGSDWYQCPLNKAPEVCTCSTCFLHKEMKRGKVQLKAAWDRNFGRNGTVFGVANTPEPPQQGQESPKEKYERQKKTRYQETERSWSQIQKKVEVPKFDLNEVLVNPELDALEPVKLDPASMLADDIESLAKEAKEFVNNPTLAGAASMAVIAIPGKFADKVIDEIPIKKIVKTIEYGDGKAIYHVDVDTNLTLYSDGVITGPHPKRGKGILPNPVGGRGKGDHRGHLIPEGGVDEPSFVNVSENIISESPNSNLGLKKSLDLKASKIAALNPDAEVRFMSEPIRKIGETRPFAVTHYIVKDGEIIDAVSVLNK